MPIKPFIVILLLLLVQTISTCYAHSYSYTEIRTDFLPTYYINNFRFLLFTEIRRGYTSEDSTFIEDSTYIEPEYIWDSKDIFFEYLYGYLGSNPYKNYNVFDMYGYISTTEPQNPWTVMNVVEDFLSETNYYEALILYGHGARVFNRDYFIYLQCLNNMLSPGEGRSTPSTWVNYVCQNNYIYYLSSERVRNIFESRPLSGLPSLVYFIACHSGRYDNIGSWRWAFRLSTNDPYSDWSTRAFIGLDTTVPGDAREAIWDDLLYYIIDSVMYGEKKNVWEAFSDYIDRVRRVWGIDVGYRAMVQSYVPGRGYVREPHEYNSNASTVYVYAGDKNVFIDPSYEEHIISYAKYSLEKYLGPLYDIISSYIVGVEVIKGFSDGLFDRYAVEFKLDSNVFKRGRSVVVYVYVYRREDIIFSHGIRISLGLGNIGFVDEFINYLVNEMQDIKESLEQRGLTVNTEVLFSYNVSEYHYYWENVRYRVYYNDVEISSIPDPGGSLLAYYIHYDMYSDRSISVNIDTGYELILYLLNRGYGFLQFNISRDYLANVLEEYGVDASVNDFKKLYLVGSKGFRPIYYLSYETCITYTYPGTLPFEKEMCTNNRLIVDGITGRVSLSPNTWMDPHTYLGDGAYYTNTTNITDYSDTNIETSTNETNDLSITLTMHKNNSKEAPNSTTASDSYAMNNGIRTLVYSAILVIIAVIIIAILKHKYFKSYQYSV